MHHAFSETSPFFEGWKVFTDFPSGTDNFPPLPPTFRVQTYLPTYKSGKFLEIFPFADYLFSRKLLNLMVGRDRLELSTKGL